jgi:hypothetical protein
MLLLPQRAEMMLFDESMSLLDHTLMSFDSDRAVLRASLEQEHNSIPCIGGSSLFLILFELEREHSNGQQFKQGLDVVTWFFVTCCNTPGGQTTRSKTTRRVSELSKSIAARNQP